MAPMALYLPPDAGGRDGERVAEVGAMGRSGEREWAAAATAGGTEEERVAREAAMG